jgi:hypothetical protein
MKSVSLKLSKKEARILSSLLLQTQKFMQLHVYEENDVIKRLEAEKLIEIIAGIRTSIKRASK